MMKLLFANSVFLLSNSTISSACSALTADIENVNRRVADNMLKNLEKKEKFQI